MATIEIVSSLPGTFYSKPAPDQADFISVGQSIHAGQVIGLIEVMKQYSELVSDQAGTVVSIELANGDEVEPGQVVAIIATEE